jgi:hypothetical protein
MVLNAVDKARMGGTAPLTVLEQCIQDEYLQLIYKIRMGQADAVIVHDMVKWINDLPWREGC